MPTKPRRVSSRSRIAGLMGSGGGAPAAHRHGKDPEAIRRHALADLDQFRQQ